MTREEITDAYGVELNSVERFRKLGLITPKRTEDGALVYSDIDGQMLRRLRILEGMGFSENDFSQLKSGEKTLESLIRRQYSRLEEGCLGKEICNQILAEGANLESFDAKKYLDQMGSHPPESTFSFNRSFYNQVYHPWRRYFARMFDISIYTLIWYLFLAYVCNVNISDMSFLLEMLGYMVTIAMMFFIEPIQLNRYGTTFGKWIFGLRVEKADGIHLLYAEGLRRTWSVIARGLGYNIPIYSFVRMYKSYKLCKAEEIQPWDEGISYTIKDTKWYRGFAYIISVIIYITVLTVIIMSQALPPNRGEVTLAEFAENYNYYCKYLDMNEGWYMDEKGLLVKKQKPSNEVVIDVLDEERPNLDYEIEDGYLRGVSFFYEVKNEKHWGEVEKTEQALVALAFGCTDKAVGLLFNSADTILTTVVYEDDFDFTIGKTRFFCDTETVGYDEDISFYDPEAYLEGALTDGEYGITDEDARDYLENVREGSGDVSIMKPSQEGENAYYSMEFSVIREK